MSVHAQTRAHIENANTCVGANTTGKSKVAIAIVGIFFAVAIVVNHRIIFMFKNFF